MTSLARRHSASTMRSPAGRRCSGAAYKMRREAAAAPGALLRCFADVLAQLGHAASTAFFGYDTRIEAEHDPIRHDIRVDTAVDETDGGWRRAEAGRLRDARFERRSPRI